MTPQSTTSTTKRLVTIAALLVGCVHPPRVGQSPYQASSQNSKGFGYSQMQVNDRTIRVTFSALTPSDARTGAIQRAAEAALEWGADGFIVARGDDYVESTVRSRFVIGRVKREQPVTVLTITLLMRSEFGLVPPGTQVYDAHLLAPDHVRRW